MNPLRGARRAKQIVRSYSNWWTVFSTRFGKGRPFTVYRFRDGHRFLLRHDDFDLHVLNNVWLERIYEPTPEFAVKEGWQVLDLGAHKGAFSVWVDQVPGTRTIAVEPDPRNFESLHFNLALNRATSVQTRQVAIAPVTSGANEYAAQDSPSYAALAAPGKAALRRANRTLTLDSLVEEMGAVDLVKINVQGSEYEVLRTASPETMSRISRIVVQCHDFDGMSAGVVAQKVSLMLEERGFHCSLWPRNVVSAYRASIEAAVEVANELVAVSA